MGPALAGYDFVRGQRAHSTSLKGRRDSILSRVTRHTNDSTITFVHILHLVMPPPSPEDAIQKAVFAHIRARGVKGLVAVHYPIRRSRLEAARPEQSRPFSAGLAKAEAAMSNWRHRECEVDWRSWAQTRYYCDRPWRSSSEKSRSRSSAYP